MSPVWISKLGMSLFRKVPVSLSEFRQDINRLSPGCVYTSAIVWATAVPTRVWRLSKGLGFCCFAWPVLQSACILSVVSKIWRQRHASSVFFLQYHQILCHKAKDQKRLSSDLLWLGSSRRLGKVSLRSFPKSSIGEERRPDPIERRNRACDLLEVLLISEISATFSRL